MSYEFRSRVGVYRTGGEWVRVDREAGITGAQMRSADPSHDETGALVPDIAPRLSLSEPIHEGPRPIRRLVLTAGRRHIVSDEIADELRAAGYAECLREPTPEPEPVHRTHPVPADVAGVLRQVEELSGRIATLEGKKR